MPAESETPTPSENALSFGEIALAIRYRGFYLNLLPYFVVLIPFIVALNLQARKWDHRLGLGPLFGDPTRGILFIAFTCAGVAVVWWSYAYLVIRGEGSPSPHLGGTRHFVSTGPYSAVRHPSVLGKLLGVIGTGCLFASPTFLCGMLPLLLAFSLLYNRFLQEAACVQQFGSEYLEYRREVPFIIPSFSRVVSLIAEAPTRQWFAAWILVAVLLMQFLQLAWHARPPLPTRYLFVPLAFTSTSEGTLPPRSAMSGPMILGPTITLEDIVRGLVVIEEHPELGLSLDATQRATILPLISQAARDRQQMLTLLDEVVRDEQHARHLASTLLDTLTEGQVRWLREHGGLPDRAQPAPPWEPLLQALTQETPTH